MSERAKINYHVIETVNGEEKIVGKTFTRKQAEAIFHPKAKKVGEENVKIVEV